MDQDDFSIKGVMNALDVENRGWITVSDLHKFVENYGVNLSEDYVCKLINVYDYDINGKISLEELEWLIEGLERSNGSYRKIVRNSDRIASKKRLNSCCTCKKIGRN
jgi:Ca2+-binding EF-hand superfamily protein